MKNTVRVRNHRTQQTAKHQAQTKGRKTVTARVETPDTLMLPAGEHHPACLAVYDRSQQSPVCRVPLTDAENDLLFLNSYGNGISCADFTAAALREKLAGKRFVPVDFNELESAKNQSNALLQLLTERIEFQCMPGSGGGENTGEFAAGIVNLINQTKHRLDVAFNDLHNAISINNEVAR